MNAFRDWFNGLAPRERVMVSAAAVVVLLALFYYALWSPLNTALENARTGVTAEANQARWMLGIRNEAELLRSSGANTRPAGANDSLLSIIDASSRANQLGTAVTHIQPQNDDKAVVSLQQAGFDQMVFWLQSLQTQYGITVSQATISRESDTPGQVEARLTLVRGAA
ncbi:type II secretion system protein GspM [Salinisphaera sp. Q1T1-3]|uniref:type II secretion system protein GspM n=1 Tax=Salinisphaera sp. Q1T1-3 TaxID=2321229 RepID=UPI000E772BEB|nr:type II secretion system protein M [Salinisphaera sp. Q1T1-3]RJS91762.1 type II secretion system protein M [Salinisphaera sp. Q1T1-3]